MYLYTNHTGKRNKEFLFAQGGMDGDTKFRTDLDRNEQTFFFFFLEVLASVFLTMFSIVTYIHT